MTINQQNQIQICNYYNMNHKGFLSIFGIILFFITIAASYYTVYQPRGTQIRTMKVVFDESVNGLEQGSYVLYLGVPVGKITSINLANDRVHVTFAIDTPFTINESSYVMLEGDSIAARRLLNVYTPSLNEPLLTSNNIRSKKTVSWSNTNYEALLLMREARQMLDECRKVLLKSRIADVFHDIDRLAIQFTVVLKQLQHKIHTRSGLLGWVI